MNQVTRPGQAVARQGAPSADMQSTQQRLREVLHALPCLSNEHLALVYQIVRQEVEHRSTGEPYSRRVRASWALARDSW